MLLQAQSYKGGGAQADRLHAGGKGSFEALLEQTGSSVERLRVAIGASKQCEP
jgi:hypothetical protein